MFEPNFDGFFWHFSMHKCLGAERSCIHVELDKGHTVPMEKSFSRGQTNFGGWW